MALQDLLNATVERLCCTNHIKDSSCESSVVAGGHEQTYTRDLQDDELACLYDALTIEFSGDRSRM